MNEDVVETKTSSLGCVQVEIPRPPSANERPPTRGKDQTLANVQRSTPNSAGKSQRTAVERQRLFPRSTSDIEVDPDAIPIALPGNNFRLDAMPKVVGLEELSVIPTLTHALQSRGRGPQPMNTLTLGSQKDPYIPAKTYTNAATASRSTFKRPVLGHLPTRPVIGDNVRTSAQRSPSANFDERPKKRAKMRDITVSTEVFTVEDDDSEEDELLSDSNTIRVERPQASKKRTSSDLSHKARPLLSSHQGRQSSQEYNTVNNIMDSSGYPQYIKEQRQKGSLSRESSNMPKATLDLPAPGSSAVDESIMISKAPYKGTARPNAQARPKDNGRNGVVKRMQTEARSRHFVDSINTNGHSATHNLSTGDTGVAQQLTEPQSPHLREQFMSTEGKRRGSGSSDPLADGPAKYAEVVRISPPTRPPTSSLPQLRPSTAVDPRSLEGDAGLPKSNIRPTKFTSLRPKQPGLLSVSKLPKGGRMAKTEGFACKSAFIDRQFLQGDNIGLVFEDNGTDLEIHQAGENLTRQCPSLKVRTQKIRKIIWSTMSLKIRLELSQTAHEDRIVDLELSSEKYRTDLIRKLQTCVQCGVIEKSRDTMDKLFANRLKEEGLHDRQKTHSYEEQDSDIQFITRKKERRDEQNQASMEALSAKRRRVSDKVADRLQPNYQDQVSSTQSVQGHEKDQAVRSRGIATETRSSSGIDVTLTKLNIHPMPNTHLTRSRLSSRSAQHQARELSPELSDFPEELRFSVQHGLGAPWRKPLVYPKEGKKKTSVDQKDLERLDEGQFLNDNLIGFYLRYLECELTKSRPVLAGKVYWFNTYFFASLTKTARGKKGINYEAVRKWTRGVDIFNYEYAVVPINESAHWYVAIICNLPALQRIPGDPGRDSPSSPAFHELESREQANDERAGGSIADTKLDEQDASQSLANLDLNDSSSILDVEELKLVDPTNDNGQEDPAAQLQAELLHEGLGVLGDQQHGPREQEALDPSIVAALLTGKSPASQKKSKRKSIPPIKRIDPDQPAIITLDSLGLSHPPTIRILKDYLLAEANDKRGGMQLDDGQIKGTTAKGIPQQDNFCDCGLFLLGYMAKFVEDPRDFVHKILQRDYNEKRDWPNLDSSKMREDVRNLIQSLHVEQHAHSPRKSMGRADPQGVISTVKTHLLLNKDESREGSSENTSGKRESGFDEVAHTRPQLPPVNMLEAPATALRADDPISRAATQEGLDPASRIDVSRSSTIKQEALARVSTIDSKEPPTTRREALATALDVDEGQPPTSRPKTLAPAVSVDDPKPSPEINAEGVRDRSNGHSRGVLVEAANVEPPSVVILDSQPEANESAQPDRESTADAKSSEHKLEPELVTPSLPPRPMAIISSSSKKRKNVREVAESPERRTRTTITIDDN
ncbi:MAG: hypothetical protein Q9187_001209 [Circinaria calcarea]